MENLEKIRDEGVSKAVPGHPRSE
jgi:hypothetical protein